MNYKNVTLCCDQITANKAQRAAAFDFVVESHFFTAESGEKVLTFLMPDECVQLLTDALQQALGHDTHYRITILTVDTVIPPLTDIALEKVKKALPEKKRFFGVSREELLDSVGSGIHFDLNFFLLIIFSTIVVAIGLLENSEAVVIGGMVIAPLLGPNLALAFSVVLGDKRLMWGALKSNFLGISACLVISVFIGFFWPYSLSSPQLLMRTSVDFANVLLALVSGAAAVLSLTRGISSVMVGVMVAVALLPPATAIGIFLGAGKLSSAYGAFILLAANVVSINFAAQITLLLKGVRPRTWYQQRAATRLARKYLLIWSALLILLAGIIYHLHPMLF